MGLIHTWDVKHGYETSCMSAHTDVVTDIVMITSLDQMVSASMDHTVRVWDCCSGALRMVRLVG
jgi:WD40 repeat protein